MNVAYKKLLKKIDERSKLTASRGGSDYVEFENDVYQLLCNLFPHSVLQSVRLFSPSQSKQRDFGLEMDNLLHIKHGGFDYIISVEVKNQPVEIDGKDWICTYTNQDQTIKRKKVNEQINNHVKLLNEYLSPVSGGVKLKFMSILVSSDTKTHIKEQHGYRNSPLILCSVKELYTVLNEHFNLGLDEELPTPEFRRITQSRFLSLLRMGQAIPELGHPELQNAIRYAERCRRDLDTQIFQDFSPSPLLWAINGSAGMGKSVLLAYTACVLACKFELRPESESSSKIILVQALDTIERMGFGITEGMVNSVAEQGFRTIHARFPKDQLQTDEGAINYDDGDIGIIAMSQKQLDSLRQWYDYFVDIFQSRDAQGRILFKRPHFFVSRHADDLKHRKWAALLVDEAHDLSEKTELVLAKEHLEKGFFLCVACDRHQKLQHVEKDARLIKGLNFSRKTKRLKQIYRNPAPIYIASLGLMFRWFNKAGIGPVVLPTVKELEDQFGFEVTPLAGNGHHLSMKTDAHPANSWSHTVGSFPDIASGYQHLLEAKLNKEDVLWVRFSKEEATFDYERLQNNFTYHNCRTREAADLSDKYIKGQEFQIVVIEGFPGFMDNWENEARMWQFRRELYLCASRATCFLYFICSNIDDEEGRRIRAEINDLVKVCSNPANPNASGTKEWKFHIPKSNNRRKLNVFSDTSHEALAAEDDEPSASEAVVGVGARELLDEENSLPAALTTPSPVDTSQPGSASHGEDSEPSLDHELQWQIAIDEQPSVTSFATAMEVEEIEIIELLNHEYDLRAVSSTLIPMPLAIKIAAEQYDCAIINNTPITESKIQETKPAVLDLISDLESSSTGTKPKTGRSSSSDLREFSQLDISKQQQNSLAGGSSRSEAAASRPAPYETKKIVAVVDHINLKKQFVSIKHVADDFIPIPLSVWPEAIDLKPGDCLSCTIDFYNSNKHRIQKYEKIPRQEVADLFIKIFGNIEKTRDRQFGFINTNRGSVFVPPRFGSRYTNQEYLEGWAIRSPDKDKNYPGATKSWTFIDSASPEKTKPSRREMQSTVTSPALKKSSATSLSKPSSINGPTGEDKIILMNEPYIVSELADAMGLKPFNLMADLIKMQVFVAPHQAVESKEARKLCLLHKFVLMKP